MIDVFDVMAFVVFAVLLAVAVIVVVTLGSLPGQIAHRRGHPQAAAVNVTAWLGVATLGLLWPLALVWAFLDQRPAAAAEAGARPGPPAAPRPGTNDELVQMQGQMQALQEALRERGGGRGVTP